MLSGTQSRVLKFIVRSINEDDMVPTLREIGAGTGLSLSGARLVVMELEARGFLRRRDHKFRALSVLKPPAEEKAVA